MPGFNPLKESDFNHDLEDIYRRVDNLVPQEQLPRLEEAIKFLASQNITSEQEYKKARVVIQKKLKFIPRKSQLLHVCNLLESRGEIEKDASFKDFLITKSSKSTSGVLVITVLTSPYPKVGDKVQEFSCQWNCYYCPNEPAHEGNNWTPQPRSYLHDEPSVLRANRNHFDPILQFHDRASTLAINGHPVDKIELLILGGTWASYPVEYQENFIRDLFYAANTFYERERRPAKSLEEEKNINETAACKIIGITLETRPDCINLEEIKRFRHYGCTRIQLGIQHTDNRILKKINRGCTTEDAIKAVRILKNNCYKIDVHLMPNLPGSNPEKDLEMFNYVLDSEDLQVDQWKIYPCETTPWTVIKKWFDEGKYVPYDEPTLIKVLLEVKKKVHPWIRLNRVIRDIPSQYILGGVDAPNLRQYLIETLKKAGTPCRCIRCREVKSDKKAIENARIFIRTYNASLGKEYFISFETPDEKTILGFVRLRIADNDNEETLPELRGVALIRELHVYGQLIATTDLNNKHAQHVGLGRKLMAKAEEIASSHGKKRIAVIAGVGVRNYYRKLGYELEGHEFMMKDLPPNHFNRNLILFMALFFLVAAYLWNTQMLKNLF